MENKDYEKEKKLRDDAAIPVRKLGFHSVRHFIFWCLEQVVKNPRRFKRDAK